MSNSWFTVLAMIVAFNTIIYLGLTLAKLLPWPQQVRPEQVRRWFSLGKKPKVVDVDQLADREFDEPDSDDPYLATRYRAARIGIPQGFALTGGLVIIVTITEMLFVSESTAVQNTLLLFSGLTLIVFSIIFSRRRIRALVLIWSWAVGTLALSLLLLIMTLYRDNGSTIFYVVIILMGFAPATLSWLPSLTIGFIIFFSIIATCWAAGLPNMAQIVLSGFAAMLGGWILLRLRLQALDALTTHETRSSAVATTDPLTAMLTPRGLLTLMPGLAAVAERSRQNICVISVDVDDLSLANSQYGMQYGDDVVCAVAQAVRSTVRRGDHVARWDGDAFLVVGLGDQPSAEALAARIQLAVRTSGINLGKWPTTVSVKTSSGDPTLVTFEEMQSMVS